MMKIILLLVVFLVFGVLWNIIINKYLPTILTDVKNNILYYRKKMKISQETLSKNLGVSRQTINAIENNKYDPSLVLAFKLAKQFSVTVDELFTY